MIDPAALETAAEALAAALAAAAYDAGFEVEACVTPVEPSWDCGRIHVWPGQISTVQAKCVAMPVVSLAWAVAYCHGTAAEETCEWWAAESRTSNGLRLLWGVYGGLLARYNDGSLCSALPSRCGDVTIGAVSVNPSADLVVYAGLLTFRFDLTEQTAS